MVTEVNSDYATSPRPAEAEPQTAICLIGTCDYRIWHQPPSERLRQAFAKAGVTDVLSPDRDEPYGGALILVRADCVLDAPVVAALVEQPGLIVGKANNSSFEALAAHAPAGEATHYGRFFESEPGATPPPPGSTLTTPEDLGASYWKALRKREVPYAIRLKSGEIGDVEWRMFKGTYKGATDLITKWLWPRPAFHATRLCTRFGITPNMVTWVSLLLTIVAFAGFWQGQWALGLLAGWLMTFLDTVDGKLARITLKSSRFGHALDHGIDLVHPPFWYVAWAYGLQHGEHAIDGNVLQIAIAVILTGYVLQRAMEGISILIFKIEIHVWRPIDSAFRQITARRNPNLVILTIFTAAGRPDWGFLAVAGWTAVCLCLHSAQLLQAWVAARRAGGLTSWMSEAAPK